MGLLRIDLHKHGYGAGLDIRVPVLVACSAASLHQRARASAAMRAGTVLDVAHIARWAPALGRHVTPVRFPGGPHDQVLSAAPIREQLFSEVDRFLAAYVVGAPAVATPARSRAGAPADVA